MATSARPLAQNETQVERENPGVIRQTLNVNARDEPCRETRKHMRGKFKFAAWVTPQGVSTENYETAKGEK